MEQDRLVVICDFLIKKCWKELAMSGDLTEILNLSVSKWQSSSLRFSVLPHYPNSKTLYCPEESFLPSIDKQLVK